MLILDFLKWWYQKGLIDLFFRLQTTFMRVFDFFSVDILIKTLFQPFKLIDNEAHGQDFISKIRAYFDRLFSSLFGAMIRLVTLIFGVLVLFILSIFLILMALFWLILPILPIIFIFLFIFGVKIW